MNELVARANAIATIDAADSPPARGRLFSVVLETRQNDAFAVTGEEHEMKACSSSLQLIVSIQPWPRPKSESRSDAE
jgi:hypothetical protein